MERERLDLSAQISDMDSKGITFQNISEEDARNILTEHTYYFKLKAYAKNYPKYKQGEKEGQYIGLDFSYLVDLSAIDFCLRHLILKISLDIEHFLKARLMKDVNIEAIDGYEIVNDFLRNDPSILPKINEKRTNNCCSSLIETYSESWAIWNIVEVLSFSDFLQLYYLFYSRTNHSNEYTLKHCLFSVKMLRNAAAHNNCLIHHLYPPYDRTVNAPMAVSTEIGYISTIKQRQANTNLDNPFVVDFSTLLFVYYKIVPRTSESYKIVRELSHQLFNIRMLEHSDYYHSNQTLKSKYNFICKIIDYFLN